MCYLLLILVFERARYCMRHGFVAFFFAVGGGDGDTKGAEKKFITREEEPEQ